MKREKYSVFCRNMRDAFLKYAVALKMRFADMKEDIRAMGTIEVVLIVAILVALALLFRSFISDYADKLFENIEDKTDTALGDW